MSDIPIVSYNPLGLSASDSPINYRPLAKLSIVRSPSSRTGIKFWPLIFKDAKDRNIALATPQVISR